MMTKKLEVKASHKEVELTNLEKRFWPAEGYTKAHLLKYYTGISNCLLPHLAGRPLVLHRYPEGIAGPSFYQKECPDYAPSWLPTVALPGSGRRQMINYILVNDVTDLLWVINQGCIELHPWLAPWSNSDHPTAAVLDLDPAPPAGFGEARRLALLLKPILKELGLQAYPKTSGASGLHLYLPLAGRYTFSQVRQALTTLATLALRTWPELCTLERAVSHRDGKVYIDVSQNGRGKTIAAVYSVRPLPGAPVSAPLSWEELEEPRLDPRAFNLASMPGRLADRGDLFAPVLTEEQSLEALMGTGRSETAGGIAKENQR